MKRCYIAGPIGNRPEEEYKAHFEEGEVLVDLMQMIPVSPVKQAHHHDKSWLNHMRVDIKALVDCDCILMLDGWHNSRGACIEHRIAIDLGLKVLIQSSCEAVIMRDLKEEALNATKEERQILRQKAQEALKIVSITKKAIHLLDEIDAMSAPTEA